MTKQTYLEYNFREETKPINSPMSKGDFFLEVNSLMNKKNYFRIISSVVAGLAVILIYTLLHEGGHAIAALLVGARITAFDVNFVTGSPHVAWEGFVKPAGRAFIAVSGPVFPVIVWLLSLSILRWHKAVAVRLGLFVASLMVISSLLPQVIIPVLYMRGLDLRGEDIVGFIIYSGLHPLVVSGLFALLVAILVWLVSKLIRPLEIVKAPWEQFRSAGPVSIRHRLMTGAMLLVIVLIAFPMVARLTTSNRHQPRFPKEYDAKVTRDFSNFANTWTSIYEFIVDELKVYDMVYSLQASAPTSLRLVTDSPKGIVFTGKDHMVMCEDATSLAFAQFLGFGLYPGNYRLEVKTTDKTGSIDMYISSKNPTPDHLYYLSIMDKLNQGTFVAEDYKEEGYELVYQGPLEACEDKLLYSINTAGRPFPVSVFVAGTYEELTITYVEKDSKQPILTNSRATMGFGITPREASGEILLPSTAAIGEVYVFLKR